VDAQPVVRQQIRDTSGAWAAVRAHQVTGAPYISGFGPDEGENLTTSSPSSPAPGIIPYVREHQLPDGGKEFTLAAEGFHESFCDDIPADDAAFYAISQRPLAAVALTEAAPAPAWRSRPVWAVLATADRCIDPASTASATTAWARR
jgi:hypothetical protein